MKKMMKGFTLVEIMIVVAIIAILAAVAIPNFVRYRKTSQMNACISNLKQLQTATEQWRMQKNGNAATVTMANLVGTDGYIKADPTCPSGGTYNPPTSQEDAWYCSWGDTDGDDFKHKMIGYDLEGKPEGQAAQQTQGS